MKCPYDPKEFGPNDPIGMYHCPLCGDMVIAGLPHYPDEDERVEGR